MRQASFPSQVDEPISPSTVAPSTLRQTLGSVVWWTGVAVKLTFASSLVIGLLVAYGLRFSVVTFGSFTFGLYGVIILADFIVQTFCSFLNRRRINGIAREGERQCAKPLDISVAVVGYREDSEAWKKCLASLQKQDHAPRAIIGVVDGQDAPDQVMAEDFRASFPEGSVLIADLPELLSQIFATAYRASMPATDGSKTLRARAAKVYRYFANIRTEDEITAEKTAWAAVHAKLDEWNAELKISQYSALCLTQPHGHKRTAMFTAFAIAIHLFKTQDAVFTTDSDTLLDHAALRQMSYILSSDPNLGGVTGDVKIWNRDESWLALMCALRYWFAFNIERACQSYWRCVTCISGPIGLYRVRDMQIILGPWILQTFLGRDCTFGDDRHLTNRLLGIGRTTAYTHLAFCESDSPAGFVRWVKQQTRWSKSFFREAFWHPSAFAYQSVWLSIETLKQTLYPFILVSTVFAFLYAPTTLLRPAYWLATMFGVALIKSTYGFAVTGDPSLLLFSFYAPLYFGGLLPSKIYALLTINVTAWGTSARSATERRKGESYSSRSSHISHLLLWFCTLGAGFVVFAHHHAAGEPLLYTLPVILPVAALCVVPYWDLVKGDLAYYASTSLAKVKASVRDPSGSISLESGGLATKERDLEKGLPDKELSLAPPMPEPALVGQLVDPLQISVPMSTERRASSESVVTFSNTGEQARVQVQKPLLVDPMADEAAAQTMTSLPSSSLTVEIAPSPVATAELDPVEVSPIAVPAAVVSRRRSADHLATSRRVSSASSVHRPSFADSYPSDQAKVDATFTGDADSRRPSLWQWSKGSWTRRKSSVGSVDSSRTLVDSESGRRYSASSRRSSLLSFTGRPSLSGRSSQATLVDEGEEAGPALGKRRSSRSRVRKSSLGQLYESAWSHSDPFAAKAGHGRPLASQTEEVEEVVTLAQVLAEELGGSGQDAMAGSRLGVKEGYQAAAVGPEVAATLQVQA